jgi:hypothetical protein
MENKLNTNPTTITSNIENNQSTNQLAQEEIKTVGKTIRNKILLVAGIILGFLFSGVGGYYLGFRESSEINTPSIRTRDNQTATVKEKLTPAPNEEGWISYIDKDRNFEIKLPINTIERSQANYNFENIKPYTAEVISSPGNFPEVSVEISDSGTNPFIPTNFKADDETTFNIGGRFNIQATRKFGYLYDTQSHNQTYVVYYLTFERNNEVYLIKYSPPLVEHRSNPEAQDAIFKQIIDSIKLTGINTVSDSELTIKDSAKYYTDPQLNYTVLVPVGWSVRHGGDNADPLIIVTNAPIEEVYDIDSEYKRIYFSRSGIIFSTSGGVCANVGCEDNGVFTTTIGGVEHTADITLTAGVQNRFIIDTKTVETGGVYIGAAYPKGSSTSDIQNIISSVQFE